MKTSLSSAPPPRRARDSAPLPPPGPRRAQTVPLDGTWQIAESIAADDRPADLRASRRSPRPRQYSHAPLRAGRRVRQLRAAQSRRRPRNHPARSADPLRSRALAPAAQLFLVSPHLHRARRRRARPPPHRQSPVRHRRLAQRPAARRAPALFHLAHVGRHRGDSLGRGERVRHPHRRAPGRVARDDGLGPGRREEPLDARHLRPRHSFSSPAIPRSKGIQTAPRLADDTLARANPPAQPLRRLRHDRTRPPCPRRVGRHRARAFRAFAASRSRPAKSARSSRRSPSPGARRWSPDDPFLHVLETTTGGDRAETRFGFRDFRFDRATGRAVLNGRPIFLRGSNITLHRFLEDPLCGRLPVGRSLAPAPPRHASARTRLEQLSLLHRPRARAVA